MSLYDAVIVGGGHNALTCAAYLARAGRKVLVLERREQVGGAAVTEELYKGFRYSVCSYIISWLRPYIIRDLKLTDFGLSIITLESAFTPYPDGRSLCRTADPAETHAEISKFSKVDADRYAEFGATMSRLARFAKGVIDQKTPLPSSFKPADLLLSLGLGKRVVDLGSELAEHQKAQSLQRKAIPIALLLIYD